jgi:uncharacterized GH25 family protein
MKTHSTATIFRKTTLLIVLISGSFGLCFSHEFWLQPIKFMLKTGEKLDVSIFVGEGFTGELWSGSKDRITKLTHYSRLGQQNALDNVSTTDPQHIKMAFSSPGNHLLAFNNDNKFIELEADKFNEYLKEEGLDNALSDRSQKGNLTKKGRELYQRCIKTLVQVADLQDDTYKINTGMMLELIPSANPYAVKGNQKVLFSVLFDNKPLPNALVLVWHYTNGKVSVKKLRSDASGQVPVALSRNGRWMISTVRMVPHTRSQEADWQSYWGSYTFGYY